MTDWLRASWPAIAGVNAGTSRRGGGVSSGPFESLNLGAHVGDDPDLVAENRRRFVETCRLPAEPYWLRQVHGTTVVELPAGGALPDADAAYTREEGVVCAVLTADCLPVVLARRDGSAVGVAHAGWRGLCAGVLESTVAAIGDPDDLVAWLGPAISQPAFEVGPEVRQAFIDVDDAAREHFSKGADGRWHGNLYGLAAQRLAAAGVDDLSGGGRCTYRESEQFFSYRRDGDCGRMATVVWIGDH